MPDEVTRRLPVATPPPAGWYADPDPQAPPGYQRWFSAEGWTEHRRAAPRPEPGNGRLVHYGYMLAVLFPIVGLVLGIILGAKGNRHGVWVIVTAIVAMGVYAWLIAAGDL